MISLNTFCHRYLYHLFGNSVNCLKPIYSNPPAVIVITASTSLAFGPVPTLSATSPSFRCPVTHPDLPIWYCLLRSGVACSLAYYSNGFSFSPHHLLTLLGAASFCASIFAVSLQFIWCCLHALITSFYQY